MSQLHLLSQSHVRPGDTKRKTGVTESLSRCLVVVAPRKKLCDLIASIGAIREGGKEEAGEGQRMTMRKLKMTVDEHPECRVLRRDCSNGGQPQAVNRLFLYVNLLARSWKNKTYHCKQ